jgi:hypothetical protein
MWIIYLINFAFSFTLVSDDAGFKNSNIKIYFTTTSCSGAGFSRSKLKSLTEEAVDEFWNKVSTSSLNLEISSTKDIDVSGITNLGEILDQAPKNSILVTCSADIPEFGEANNGILGVGTMSCSGSTCRGTLAINSHSESSVSTLNHSDLVATMAHELGHSIGLGHSEYRHNLMYYSIGGKTQKFLGQDDIDGITYLYPHDQQFMGLLGSCGTLGMHSMAPSFLTGFGLIYFFKRKRKK